MGVNPTRRTGSFQPEAIEAAVEGGNKAAVAFETNVPVRGAASRQAATRVNAEQASKVKMWEPTRQYIGEGRRCWEKGNGWNRPSHERSDPMVPPGYWQRHVDKREMSATREALFGGGCVLQPDSREGQAGPIGVADRLEVPLKPGNSGGGKGPEFKTSVTKSTRAGRLA